MQANFPDDPQLLKYKKRFYQAATRMVGRDLKSEAIPIRFQYLGYSSQGGGVTGMCRVWTNTDGELISRYVEIDPVFWASADEPQKQNLIFHEFGHCSLRRPHRPEVKAGVPVSLMFPDLLSGELFFDHMRTYLGELFSNSYLRSQQAPQMFAVKDSRSDYEINNQDLVLIKNVFRSGGQGPSCTLEIENKSPDRKGPKVWSEAH